MGIPNCCSGDAGKDLWGAHTFSTVLSKRYTPEFAACIVSYVCYQTIFPHFERMEFNLLFWWMQEKIDAERATREATLEMMQREIRDSMTAHNESEESFQHMVRRQRGPGSAFGKRRPARSDVHVLY